jgi:hypothetical protein
MRTSFRSLAACLALVSLAACADNAASPTASRSISAASKPGFDYSGNSDRGGLFGDQTAKFVLTNGGGTFDVNGLFTVEFPAGSVVCVAKSIDSKCEALGSDGAELKATVRLGSNGLSVEFSPHVIFKPYQVKLSTNVFAGLLTSQRTFFLNNTWALRPFAVAYTANPGGKSINDYAIDPMLITHVNLTSGLVWRYLNSMSGYMMGGGDSCTPTPANPDCVAIII